MTTAAMATNKYAAPTTRLAYAEAYELKTGGFRGVAKNMLTGEIKRGDIRDTLQQAKYDAKAFVFEFAAHRNMIAGTYRNPKGAWKCNFFIRTDETELTQ